MIARLALLAVLALSSLTAEAQTRVRGTIVTFDGQVLLVRSAGENLPRINVGEKTEIVFAQPIALSEIKAGDFLGVTSMKRADGTLTAIEVRRFPKPLNPGHRPFDGRDDQTMTNAAVEATVSAASGRELTMAYPGGTQKILVPDSASISTLVPGRPWQLVSGAAVNLTHDEQRVALRIQVSPPPSPTLR